MNPYEELNKNGERFADYFFVCGLTHDTLLADKKVEPGEPLFADGVSSKDSPTQPQDPNSSLPSPAPLSAEYNAHSPHRLSLPDIVSFSATLPPIIPREEDAPKIIPILKEQQSDLLDGVPVGVCEPVHLKHPVRQKYRPEILCRYPQTDYPSAKFPSYLSMFCYPSGMTMARGLSTAAPPATHHYFISTDEIGTKLHGTCIIIYEKVSGSLREQVDQQITKWKKKYITTNQLEYISHIKQQIEREEILIKTAKATLTGLPVLSDAEREVTLESISLSEERILLFEQLIQPVEEAMAISTDQIYLPKTVGILSHWPLYGILKDWICKLLLDFCIQPSSHIKLLPLERYIVNIIDEVIFPPPGRYEISITFNDLKLYFHRPPANSMPPLKMFSIFPLFRSLSVENIILTLECVLAEKKIVFVSSSYSMLALAADIVCLLMFPFQWQFVYVPLLPESLTSFLQAPVPFIAGVHSSFEGLDSVPSEVVRVFIDEDRLEITESLIPLPYRLRKKLIARLNIYSNLGSNMVQKGVPVSEKVAYPKGKYIPSNINSLFKQSSKCRRSPTLRYANKNKVGKPGNPTRPLLGQAPPLLSKKNLEVPNLKRQNSKSSTISKASGKIPEESGSLKISGKPLQFNDIYPAPDIGDVSLSSSSEDSDEEEASKSPSTLKSHHGRSNVSLASIRSDSIASTPIPPKMNIPIFSSLMSKMKSTEKSKPSPATIAREIHSMENELLAGSRPYQAPPRQEILLPTIVVKKEGHAFTDIIKPMEALSPCSVGLCGEEDGQGIDYEEFDYFSGPKSMPSSTRMQCQGCGTVICLCCIQYCMFPCTFVFSEEKIRNSFMGMFITLVKQYRQFLMVANGEVEGDVILDEVFKKKEFLEAAERDSKPFLVSFLETQSFMQFLLDRIHKTSNDFEILYVDECIKMKLNRSLLKLSKETTPFLKDDYYRVIKTLHSETPNEDGIEGPDKSTFVASLRPEWLCQGRLFNPNFLPEEKLYLQVYTNSITRMQRIEKDRQKTKQDFSNWMKNKLQMKTQGANVQLEKDMQDYHEVMSSFEDINMDARVQQVFKSVWQLHEEYTCLAMKESYESRQGEVLPFLDKQVALLNSYKEGEDINFYVLEDIQLLTHFISILRGKIATLS